jgi:hypothetical protein
MQKPIEGLLRNAENVGGRVTIGEKPAQNHVEKPPQTRAYLEPISSSLQKPIGGRSAALLSGLYKGTINKGGIVFSTHNSSNPFTFEVSMQPAYGTTV